MILAEEQLAEGSFDEFYVDRSSQAGYVRLYEAKLLHLFGHRYATFAGVSQADAYNGNAREVSVEERFDPTFVVKPRYWIPTGLFRKIIERYEDQKGYLLAYREITNTTNERTCISTIIPETAVTRNTVSCLRVRVGTYRALLQANLSALCFDYTVRQKVAGTHLSYSIMKQLPFLSPSLYQAPARWSHTETYQDWIIPRVLELTYTAKDLQPFAADCCYNAPPFRWDEKRRFLLRCELDAAYFHLYGITCDDVDYIMETFPIVKRNDMRRYGDYLTKRMILDIYDRMQQAIDTGEPYQTLLDPPPADPRVAHPPRTEN